MSYARTTISASAKQIVVVVPAVQTRTSKKTLPAIRAVPKVTRRNRETVSQVETVVKTDVACRGRAPRAARIATTVVAPRPAPKKMRIVTPNETRTTSVPQHRTKKAGKSLLKVREQVYVKADDMRLRWLNLSEEGKLELCTEMNTHLPLGPINEERKCMGLAMVDEPAGPVGCSKLRFVADDKLNRVHPIVSRLVGVYKVTDADLTQSEIDNRIAAAQREAEEDAMVKEAARIQAERLARVPVLIFTPPSPVKKAVILTSTGLPGGLQVPVLNRFGRLDNEDDYDYEEEEEEVVELSEWEKVVEEFKWEIVEGEDLYETY